MGFQIALCGKALGMGVYNIRQAGVFKLCGPAGCEVRSFPGMCQKGIHVHIMTALLRTRQRRSQEAPNEC